MRLTSRYSDEPDGPFSAIPTVTTPTRQRNRRRESGFVCTFWELLIAVVIVAVLFGTIINGYVASGTMAEWSGYSLAAQSSGVQCLEQVRSAVWDIALGKNEVTNLNLNNRSLIVSNQSYTYTGYTTNILDVPYQSTNYVIVTNFITISMIYANNSTNVPVQLQVVRVDTVWAFPDWKNYSSQMLYTNSIGTYMAPDNRDPGTLGCIDQ